MAHIVCITSGLTGILHASLELVARLEAAGHQVTYACPQSVGEKVTAQGFGYIQLAPVNYFPAPDLPDFQGQWRKIKRWGYKIRYHKSRQQAAIRALGMVDFEKKIAQLKADMWIIDVELHDHIFCAIANNQKVLLLSQWFSLWPQKGLPPLLAATIPGEGWRGSSLGLAVTWWMLKRQRWWIFFKQKLSSGGTNRRTILKKYAEEIGFPKKYIPENYWPGPFTYRHLPVINITLAELEFPHTYREHSTYVGPMVFENRIDIESHETIERQLEALFKEKKEKNKVLIYCSVSTYRAGDQVFLKKIVKAVENEPDWLLILGLGGLLETNFLAPLPNNVYAFGWIPQLKILAKADLSINHGGIHTINECVHFRVPMLVYSGKKSDQNGCAARVHYHQIGKMADKDVDDEAAIKANIHEVLTNKTYRKNIEQMHLLAEKCKTEHSLEKVVEKMLNR